MIQVYNKNNENYDRNGDITLEPQECVLYAKVNGEIRIELMHKYDEIGRWKYLQEENVIACPTPWSDKQLFRIYKKEKGNKSMKVYARHIYFDLRHEPIIDRRPTDKNGEDALAIILQGTKFTGHSNILTKETAYYVRKNVLAAISGEDENSFLNRWGGEILPDNFDLYIYDRIGEDRGVSATFGHNLKEIKETIDSDNVMTRIIPVGADGLMLTGDKPWIDSDNIGAYPMIKSRFIDYGDIKVKSGETDEDGYETVEQAREALKQAARTDFENGADEPTVNYVVNMVLLENTTEYRRYKMLERVLLGDTIHCKHKGIEIDIKARCVSIEWDCVRRKNRKIELGNYVQTFFDEQRSVNKKIENKVGNTYTKEQVNDMLNDYLEDINGKKYLTSEELKNILIWYVKTEDLSSALTEMLTECVKTGDLPEVLAGYVKTEDLPSALTEMLTEYVKTGDLPEVLAGYVKTEDLPSALTEMLTEYVKTGDLPEVLAGYVKTEDLPSALTEMLTEYVKTGDLPEVLAGYVKTEDLPELLADYVTEEELPNILTGYVKQDVYDAKIKEIEEKLEQLGGGI